MHACAGCRRRSPRRTRAGYLGKDILGTGFDLDVVVHAGAGRLHLRRGDRAARLARGLPRPAAAEAAVPRDRRALRQPDRGQQRRVDRQRARRSSIGGADWFKSIGPGEVARASRSTRCPATSPGPASTKRRWAPRCASCSSWPAACATGHELKFWTPGGSSTPLFTAEHLDAAAGLRGRGRRPARCSAPRRCRSSTSTTCVVRAVMRWTEFYAHESCGKCTPCREGTYWMVQILRAARGRRRRRRTSTRCSTPATTSSAGRSARSATAPSARSSPRSSTSATSTSRTGSSGGCPFDPAALRRCSTLRERALMTPLEARVDDGAPSAGTRPGHVTIDGIAISVPKGTLIIRAAELLGIADPAVLRPPAARPGRRLPAVPRRGRGAAQAGRARARSR